MVDNRFKIAAIDRQRDRRVGVIDIGSNSIRLVVYDRLSRSALPVFNEKVMCGLGRGLGITGRLDREGVERALNNLERFTLLLEGMAVDRVDVLATAAVRDAEDGADFITEVHRRCGLAVSLLSGAEEARLSALGVVAGATVVDGVTGDLGGGSLELVGIADRTIQEQETLPLGALRLASVEGGRDAVRAHIRRALATQPWLGGYAGRAFYAVGGNWRALAKVHLALRNHPLHIIHHYDVAAADVLELTRVLGQQARASLERLPGISRRRIETLPLAAMVLQGVLEAISADRVIFSAYGLREGHLYDLLSPEEQAADPLLHAAGEYARHSGRFGHAEVIADWTTPLFPRETAGQRRLRRAAALMSDLGWAEHPDYRAEHAFLRVLRLPVAGMDHAERVFLAATIHGRYGGSMRALLDDPVMTLMGPEDRDRANALGAALRLGHTLTGGAVELLERTRLMLTATEVVLLLAPHVAALSGDVVERRLATLSRHLGREGRIVVDAGEDAVVGL